MSKTTKLGIFFLLLAVLGAGLAMLLWLTQPAPTQTLKLNIPLGIGIYQVENLDIFKKYAQDNDRVSARPAQIDLLDDIKIGKKVLFFGWRDDPERMISLAKQKGIKIVAYNLEGPLTKEELIAKQKAAYELAKKNGLFFVFGPTVVNLQKYYADFSLYADAIALQAQRFQLEDDYEEQIEGLIDKIKSVNSKIEVWVQVSVGPPDPKTRQYVALTANEVIKDIMLVQDKADSISIFYSPQDPSVMEEVFQDLRT